MSVQGPKLAAFGLEQRTAKIAPASILIQTPGLVAPELLVELVPVAIVPYERYHEPTWAVG
ncbi:hypothetical protein ABWI00_07460 [Algihabitans albus]|uniref:hypothetical protein n=1 Tax=Algihabitans albus TaxID=2164067 RepID=UPI0035CFD047